MHVAILFEFPSLNGGEMSMLASLRHLTESRRLRFTAIAPVSGPLADQLAALGIAVVSPGPRASDVRNPHDSIIPTLIAICRELRVDVIHANSLAMARLTGQLAGILDASSAENHTADISGGSIGRWPRPLCSGHLRDIVGLSQRAIQDLNRNDILIAVSSAARDFHLRQGVAPGRCRVIHNGVDGSLFTPRDRDQMRAGCLPQFTSDTKILLSVGQICLRKGQTDVAEAIVRYLQSGAAEPVHWVIAGERYSTKTESVIYEQTLQRLFDEVCLGNHIHRIGRREDISQLMNSADLLIHGARQEPFGRVLLEAAASGLPILTTNVGGTCEMLEDGNEALLVPPGDPVAMEFGIRQLLTDATLAQKLSQNARHRILKHFTVEAAAEKLAEVWLSASPILEQSDRAAEEQRHR